MTEVYEVRTRSGPVASCLWWKGERSAKRSKTTGEDSMFGWGKKDKPKKKKKRNVPDVEIHVPELDTDRLEITLENLRAHVDVEATIGRPGNEFVNISIGVNARIDSAQIVLEDVQAEAHVIAYLDDIRVIALRALEVLDHHPEILTGLVEVPIPDPEPVGAKGPQEPAEREKEDKSVHQALDRGRAMLQRVGAELRRTIFLRSWALSTPPASLQPLLP